MVEATLVRAHASVAGYGTQSIEGLGRSSGGFSTKIHTKVDTLRNPLQLSITPDQVSEITQSFN